MVGIAVQQPGGPEFIEKRLGLIKYLRCYCRAQERGQGHAAVSSDEVKPRPGRDGADDTAPISRHGSDSDMEFGDASVSCVLQDLLEPVDELACQIRIDGRDSISCRGRIKIECLHNKRPPPPGRMLSLGLVRIRSMATGRGFVTARYPTVTSPGSWYSVTTGPSPAAAVMSFVHRPTALIT